MDSISKEALAFARAGAPQFIKRIEEAKTQRKERKRPTVVVTLNAFNDNFMLLYACLWYAGSCGVTVSMQPFHRGEETLSCGQEA